MRASEAATPVDVALLLQILVMLSALNVILLFVKVRTVVGWLTPAVLPPLRTIEEVQQIVRHVDAIMRRAPFLLQGHCLLRSLTLYYLCTRMGYPVQISFGVRQKSDGTLHGHGWLLLNDRPFMECGNPEGSFLPVWRMPVTPMEPRPR